MSSLNVIIFEGRLGRSPECKAVGETRVAKFSLANSRKVKGEDKTIWVDVETWGKTAELVEKYVGKGDSIKVVGELDVSTWEKDGVKKSRTYIRAREVYFGSKAKPKEGNDSEKPNSSASAPPKDWKEPEPEFDGGPQPDADIPF
jgi:single-strand DNA-binding protein